MNDPLGSLAVVVVNFGTHRLVEENLLRSLGPAFPGSVVVVDNWRDADERRAIADVCRANGWQCVEVDTNEGFGGGCNRGAQEAIRRGSRELLMVNPDAWLEPDTVRELHARVRADRRLLLAPKVLRPGGRLYSDENDLYLDRGDMLWTRHRPDDVDTGRVHTWVSGACFALSTELWQASGGFDEDYFLYWEDVDLSRRVVTVGGRVAVADDLHAIHDEGSSQRSDAPAEPGAKSPLYFYYNARNRLVYAAKHLGPADQARWLRSTPRTSYGLALQAGRRNWTHPSKNLWPVIRGVWHGARHLRAARRAARSA